MALVLHLDTALQQANIGIAADGKLIENIQNEDQYSHASFVQPAIQRVLQQTKINIEDIAAFGITSGPGSYTGLRVAMSSAKGLCFVLGKPLLSVSTLEVMTMAAIEKFPGFDYYCPMIDARRNEVFTALYTPMLKVKMAAQPVILDSSSFEQELSKASILFFGSGSLKCKSLIRYYNNAFFELVEYGGMHIAKCLFNSFKNSVFDDLAYSEPLYLKDFYLGKPTLNT